MWFKNLQVYRFTQPFTLTSNELNEQLSTNTFTPCSTQEPYKFGWVPPLGNLGEEWVHSANGFMMICAKRQEKILPAGVINERLNEKIEQIAQAEHRKVSRKEKMGFREEIVFDMMPRAFARTQLQFAYIDTTNQWLVINSSSENKAEELINQLRECIGSVPVIPFSAKNTPMQILTAWLKNNPPKGFSLGEECELSDNAEKSGRISCRGQNLFADEIQSHVKAGMSVSKLAIQWEDRLNCVINEKLGIRKLKFSDLTQEKAANSDDKREQFDIDFAIMTLEIADFLKALSQAMNGN